MGREHLQRGGGTWLRSGLRLRGTSSNREHVGLGAMSGKEGRTACARLAFGLVLAPGCPWGPWHHCMPL